MSEIHQFAREIDPARLSSALLVGAALLTVFFGLMRNGRPFTKQLPAIIFGVGVWMAILIPIVDELSKVLSALFVTLSMFGLLLHVWLRRHKHYRDDIVSGPLFGGPLLFLAPAFAISGALLLYDLESKGQFQWGWENTTILDMYSLAEQGVSVIALLGRSLLWHDGMLMSNEGTLTYGVPTYALLTGFQVSKWSLRLVPALSTLLTFGVAYAFGARFFNRVTGVLFAIVLTLNEAALHFGRYGISVGPTLLTLLIAVYAAFSLMKEGARARFQTFVAIAAVYLATLGYAPARAILGLLVVYVPLVALKTWRPFARAERRTLLVFFGGLGLVAAVQASTGSFQSLFSAGSGSGEQYLLLIERPLYATPSSRVALAYDLVTRGVSRLSHAVIPALSRPRHPLVEEPPDVSLYHPSFVVFLISGLIYSIARWRSWRHQFFLLWAVAVSLPALLSTDANIYAYYYLVVPFSLWIAFGLLEGGRIMRIAAVPQTVVGIFAAMLLVPLTIEGLRLTGFFRASSVGRVGGTYGAEIAAGYVDDIAGRVVFGTDQNSYFLGDAVLRFFERTRVNRGETVSILPHVHENTLSELDLLRLPGRMKAFMRFLGDRPLVLYPASHYPEMEEALRPLGFEVSEHGGHVHNVWLVFPEGEKELAKGYELLAASDPPAPRKIPSTGKIPLSALSPDEVGYDALPPRYDPDGPRSPDAALAPYKHVIEVFSGSSLSFGLPEGSVGFISVVGLSVDPANCSGGTMTFTVTDDSGKRLYYSGLVDADYPSRIISVPLEGARSIELVSTNAGDGGHCDYGFWGDPQILLRATPAAAGRAASSASGSRRSH